MPGLPVGSCGFRCGMRHRAVQPLTAFVKLMWALGQARDGKPIYADKRRRGACPPDQAGVSRAQVLDVV